MQKKRVIIAGGGTAGWMTAAALSKLLGKTLDLTLIESDEIGTVGVGEATIPTLHIYHQLLGLKENEVMAATNATFKLGISFENWRAIGMDYIHSFGFLGQDCWAAQFHHFWVKGQQLGVVQPIGDYCVEHLAAREHRFGIYPNQERNHAYHLDATLYAAFLRNFAEVYGCKRVEGKISDVTLCADNGFIESIKMESGEILQGDLFIDCTGFGGLLIEKTLHTGYEDWSHWLPCDRAVAVQTVSNGELIPYTRSIAHEAGWQWRIPLQNRTGNGMVFCSRYWTDDEAFAKLTENLDGEMITKPRYISFRTGTRRLHWNKNCVAIGLSSGFIEPLESTSIHMIQRSIVKLMLLFPTTSIQQSDIDEFNRQTREEMEHIRDFIVLHYHVTERQDSKFWRYCKGMKIPPTLTHRLDLFRETGRIYKYDKDLFGEASWVQVMMGQGIMPKTYHPIVDLMSKNELQKFFDAISLKTKEKVLQLPLHADFIKNYCPMVERDENALACATEKPAEFSLKSAFDFRVDRIGDAQIPLLIADNICEDEGQSLRVLAGRLRFDMDASSMYPGVRADLPSVYVAALFRKVINVLYEIYKIPLDLKPVLKQACFSLITQPSSALTPLQRIPHFDNTSPYFFALLHYLGEGQHGDTAFFRHNPTGLERICEIDKENYFAVASQFLSNHADADNQYINQTNDHYTLYYKIPYITDRLAVYPGNMLHSVIINPGADISWNSQSGRLTANVFVSFE